jgi:hypothetical protein
MTPRPRSPGGGSPGGGSNSGGSPGGGSNSGGTPPGRPGRPHTGNAGAGINSAITTTQHTATAGRPAGAGGTGQMTSPSTAELRRDADPTPRPGETADQAAARADAAQQELALRQATETYDALGEDPPRLNIAANDATYGSNGAHTNERHGPDVPLRRGDAQPGDRTIEGRIYGDPPWGNSQNWSYRWSDASTMNRTVNDYIRANWDDIRSDLALNGEHSRTFRAENRTGEGFYNEGMYGAGPQSAHYAQTNYATVRLRLVPGNPPTFMVVSAFPSGLP